MIIFSKRIPSVSVVMPVYNGGKYLAEAIKSILDQTFPDFEFIIIDDGSSDRSVRIISEFKDRRIFLKQNAANEGDCRCRNFGMKTARGKYICVMDQDDISEPERLQKQFQFMEINPDTGICGSYAKNIPSNILTMFATDFDQLKVEFLSNNFCVHSSRFMQRMYLDKFNLRYNEDVRYACDFDFCARALRYFKVQNIPDVLLQYRRHPEQTSVTKSTEVTNHADMIRVNQLIDNLGFQLEEIPVLLHLKLMKKQSIELRYKSKAEQWVHRILNKNKYVGFYDQNLLQQFLSTCVIFS